MTDEWTALHRVRVLALPLDVQARAQEHHDELMREFALLDIVAPSAREGEEVPQRLLDLIESLGHQYGGIGAPADRERDEAAARGDATVDLDYQVPAAVAEACDKLTSMLDEADEFCRAGERLLTLATPPDLVAYRHWFLGEFRRQIEGEPPMPWPQYAAAHGVGVPEQGSGPTT